MEEKYVINFDTATIFKVDKNYELHFYDRHYSTFEDAKYDLISYWENLLANAKINFSAVKKIKQSDVKSFLK